MYSRFKNADLILRDELAIERTLLANERTLLAYLRTALALIIGGLTIVHFSQSTWYGAIGIACVPLGIVTGLTGVARYGKTHRSIRRVRRRADGQQGKDTGSEPAATP